MTGILDISPDNDSSGETQFRGWSPPGDSSGEHYPHQQAETGQSGRGNYSASLIGFNSLCIKVKS